MLYSGHLYDRFTSIASSFFVSFFELFDKFIVMINAVKIEFISATEYYR